MRPEEEWDSFRQLRLVIGREQPRTSVEKEREEQRGAEEQEDRKIITLQYLLAALCDADWRQEGTRRLGLRHPHTKEVETILSQIFDGRVRAADVATAHPNVLMSAMKELLETIPPLFGDEELLCIGSKSEADLVITYLHGLIRSLRHPLAQIACLLARSLQNLVELSSDREASVTDVLMIFCPLLFPLCAARSTSFVRAARALLAMMQHGDRVFGGDSVDMEDLLHSLDGLQRRLAEQGEEEVDEWQSDQSDSMNSSLISTSSQHYYSFTFE